MKLEPCPHDELVKRLRAQADSYPTVWDGVQYKDAPFAALLKEAASALIESRRGVINECKWPACDCTESMERGRQCKALSPAPSESRLQPRREVLEEAANTKPLRSAGKPPNGLWGGEYQRGWDNAVVAYEQAIRALPDTAAGEPNAVPLTKWADRSDKHPDCEDRCQILEHKGYHTCAQTGRCEFLAADATPSPTDAGGK